MHPSSLIFLVIIAIWAAYLLRHWVRRREHLATARSVDRFSDAMRVLERRAPPPETNLAAPQPRSYAVSPVRPSRPEVVVKRVLPSTSERTSAVRPTRTFKALAGLSARRVRVLSFLASLVLLVVVTPLAVLRIAPWWGAVGAVAVLVADVAWLRSAAKSERQARRRTGPTGASADVPAPHLAVSRVADHASPRSPRRKTRLVAKAPTRKAPATKAPARTAPARTAPATKAPARTASVVGDVTPAAVPDVATADQIGWQPVPVPPPTYTLKAKAVRPGPVAIDEPDLEDTQEMPAIVLTSTFDGLVDEGELDGVLNRRRAAGP